MRVLLIETKFILVGLILLFLILITPIAMTTGVFSKQPRGSSYSSDTAYKVLTELPTPKKVKIRASAKQVKTTATKSGAQANIAASTIGKVKENKAMIKDKQKEPERSIPKPVGEPIIIGD